ncbi:MAG: MFS transporter [Acidiferrobacteraceae bacterium]|jgi:MFS family permease|nr:MFS transporter [Acidiferrobacteraceae bacterium]MDP6398570.1 MFS transporter [Arenicellales bacterium]MDP6552973.1 MFS transporter [Arenicellales bacterium]MDP6791151.1 MFS transporter [Arenicellales bacterium]MDP6918849.1 MFS transporter [Arenicellales bacterium]|tara:strand:- start:15594 stop:16961 length:1368 start_codon:yes stop_codon:yes gene_type:complete
MNTSERRSVAALAGVFSLRMFGLFLVLPVMALYAAQFDGATPFMIGLAVGIYGLTQALFQIGFGALSDRFGRKPLIILGLLVFALGSMVAAVSDTLTGVIIGRALQGSGAIAAVVLALVADLTREQQRVKAMAVIGISIGASFLLALMAGPVLDRWVGLSGLFWLTAALALGCIAVIAWWVPTPQHAARDPGSRASRVYFREVLANGHLLRLDLGIFILHMVLTAAFVVIPFTLVDTLDLKRDAHWQVYVPVLIGSALLMAPLLIVGMRREDTFRVFRIAIAIVLAAQLMLLVGTDQAIPLVAGLLSFFVGFNLLEAMLPSLMTRLAPGYAKGTAIGVYNTFEFAGVFAGGALGGILLGMFDGSAVFAFSALATFVWLILAFTGTTPELRNSVTLRLDSEADLDLESLELQLGALRGVDHVTVLPREGIAYIRVDESCFDLHQAHTVPGVLPLPQ